MQTGTFRTVSEMKQCLKPEETSRKNPCCGLKWVKRPLVKEILKEIGIDDESSDSEADFEDDVSPSKGPPGGGFRQIPTISYHFRPIPRPIPTWQTEAF